MAYKVKRTSTYLLSGLGQEPKDVEALVVRETPGRKNEFQLSPIQMVIGTAGAALGTYHGYKRSGGSIGWTLAWGLFGAFLPVLAVPIALAQGFGKPEAPALPPELPAPIGP
jgi:hypothetical protein